MDATLQFYEAEWRKERDARLALERRTGSSDAELSRLQQQNARLQRELAEQKRSLEAAESALETVRAETERQARRNTNLQRQLETLNLELAEPAFWEELAATPLGEALDDFERLPEVVEEGVLGDVGDLALEAAQLLSELETHFQADKAERLQGILTAQWIYARWLEVQSELGR